MAHRVAMEGSWRHAAAHAAVPPGAFACPALGVHRPRPLPRPTACAPPRPAGPRDAGPGWTRAMASHRRTAGHALPRRFAVRARIFWSFWSDVLDGLGASSSARVAGGPLRPTPRLASAGRWPPWGRRPLGLQPGVLPWRRTAAKPAPGVRVGRCRGRSRPRGGRGTAQAAVPGAARHSRMGARGAPGAKAPGADGIRCGQPAPSGPRCSVPAAPGRAAVRPGTGIPSGCAGGCGGRRRSP